MSTTSEREAALVLEIESLNKQLVTLAESDHAFRDHQMAWAQELMGERNRARGMSKQALKLLQEVYRVLRDDAAAVACQSVSQYRSMQLREISARIKKAVSSDPLDTHDVWARTAIEGSHIEVGCFDADGRMHQMKPLSVDQGRKLITQIEQSICKVISRDPAAQINSAPSPMSRNAVLIPPDTDAEVLERQYARAKVEGDVTRDGVYYRWWLEAVAGAGFKLFREPHHSDEDMRRAEAELRATFDVVVVHYARIEAPVEAGPSPTL